LFVVVLGGGWLGGVLGVCLCGVWGVFCVCLVFGGLVGQVLVFFLGLGLLGVGWGFVCGKWSGLVLGCGGGFLVAGALGFGFDASGGCCRGLVFWFGGWWGLLGEGYKTWKDSLEKGPEQRSCLVQERRKRRGGAFQGKPRQKKKGPNRLEGRQGKQRSGTGKKNKKRGARKRSLGGIELGRGTADTGWGGKRGLVKELNCMVTRKRKETGYILNG